MIKLKNHEIVPTDDGHNTLKSLTFDENCHSTAGAYAETIYNYVEGCNVADKIGQSPITIFEVGFGLGMGLKATLESLNKLKHKLVFISTEIDEELIGFAKDITLIESNYFQYSQLEKTKYGYGLTSDLLDVHILIGDALETVPAFFQTSRLAINAIYQDPFSPKKNPALWTTEWFSLLKKLSAKDVVLSTYSASHSVKEALNDAGFKIEKRKGFANKRSSTRAYL